RRQRSRSQPRVGEAAAPRPRCGADRAAAGPSGRAPRSGAILTLGAKMPVYDLEEQEKIDDLKAWWGVYGKYVSAAVLTVAVVVVSMQGWRWYQGNQAEKASVLYQAVSQ